MAYHSDWPGGPRDPGRTPSGGTCGAVLLAPIACLLASPSERARPLGWSVLTLGHPDTGSARATSSKGPARFKERPAEEPHRLDRAAPDKPLSLSPLFRVVVKRGRKADKTSTTLSGGSLGSRVDEERSQLRELV